MFRKVSIISSKDLLINEQIRDKQIRVIGDDGEQLGILSAEEAMNIASQKNLDLVLIAPQAAPKVCKIMDYGKYRFELAKKEKENKKNQKVIDIKEVRLSPAIDTHDFDTKLKNAIKFLQHGNKVKVSVRFRGREIKHSSLGKELLDRFAESANEAGTVEKLPKFEGRSMFIIMAPKQEA